MIRRINKSLTLKAGRRVKNAIVQPQFPAAIVYLSERPSDRNNPNSRTVFMLTIEGQPPIPFDPASKFPNMIVSNGDVEDWIIENRTQELHAFHIHQLHFLLIQSNGIPVDEPFLRDTVNVKYWDGKKQHLPKRQIANGFQESAHRRYVRLPLPSSRA